MGATDLIAALLGAAAALLFTMSFALQQRANLRVMEVGASGAGPVVRRREWIGGMALQPAGFALQATALGLGAFALVQPALVLGIVFMVPAGAWVVGRRAERRDWAAAVIVLLGLGVFELATRPEPGLETAPWAAWAGPLLVALAAFVALFAAGQALGPFRAALRGAAVGVWGGVLGALTKQVVGAGSEGLDAILTQWATWLLLAAGLANIVFVNLALRAGRLASAQATMAALTPAASLFLAVAVFGEHLAPGLAGRAGALVGAGLCAAGIARLARSPSLLALEPHPEPEREPATSPPGGTGYERSAA